MISPELREPRDLLRQRLVLVAKRTRCKNTVLGLLAQYNVATPEEVPALPRFQWLGRAPWRRNSLTA